ncbi:MAG: N-methyl-L-tryptophan oxidase [Streptosporangiales bacterium]|nr:N-methyl-L-tryptophan oxidase [Streptosporangiales bacterium]
MTAYDAIVVGVGGMGSAAAYHLAARGHRVLGVERFTPAHDQGSSHGRSRVIRQAYHEHPSYVPLVLRAYELWREVERESGRRLLTVTGGIMVSTRDAGLVTGGLHSAEQWNLPHELLDAAEVRRRFPTLTPGDDVVGLYEPNTGFVRPEEAVRAHGELAAKAGAELRYGEQVTGWAANGDGVEVTTRHGTYAGGRLVLCPGAWAPLLLPDLPVPLAVERQVMHWFEPAGDLAAFAADRHPVYLWGESDDDLLYGFPAHDGETAVKAAFYRRPDRCTPEDMDRTVSPAEVEEIAAFMHTRIPSAVGRHVTSKTCMYTLTPDHDFVVGLHPAHANVVVACGFSGHGFKFVPVMGEILADLATVGRTTHDIALFDPTRTPRR